MRLLTFATGMLKRFAACRAVNVSPLDSALRILVACGVFTKRPFFALVIYFLTLIMIASSHCHQGAIVTSIM
jgi:hypothetical protein